MKHSKLKKAAQLFYIFLKAGSFTFGGGLAMLPVIKKDIVDKYKLLDEAAFYEYATLSQTLPGVIAINCAVFTGRASAGLFGAFCAALGAFLPSLVLMAAATAAISFIPRGGFVDGAFRGVRAASGALILSAAWTLGKHNVKSLFAVSVALGAFALIVFVRLNAFPVVLAAGAAGIAYAFAFGGRKEKNK